MKVRLTFKLTPESRDELLGSGKSYREFREMIERVTAQGAFGPPAKITHRWLLDSGCWDDSQPQPVEYVEQEMTTMEPEVIEAEPVTDPPTIPAWGAISVGDISQIPMACRKWAEMGGAPFQILQHKNQFNMDMFTVVGFADEKAAMAAQKPAVSPIVNADGNTPDERYNS